MTEPTRLIRENAELIRQGLAVLEKLDDDAYARPEPQLGSAGIGVHFRHISDFYTCLLRDVRGGALDFDQRERDPRIETERGAAVTRLRELLGALESFERLPADHPVEVRIDAAPQDEPPTRSTLGRELQTLLSHTVHHYSVIALLLRANGESPPQHFGVAPSTLRYWREQRARGA